MDVPGEKLPGDLPAYLRAAVAPEVPEELRPGFLDAIASGDIRSMQNKQLAAAPLHQPGEGLLLLPLLHLLLLRQLSLPSRP